MYNRPTDGTIILILKFITVWLRLFTPGGMHAIAAENILLRKQLIIINHHRKRAPALCTSDRIIFGILTSMISLKRLSCIAVLLKPAILLKFHHALVKYKYHYFFQKNH